MASWRPLVVSDDLPPLLVASEFKSNAYAVYLTDLTSIWCESLELRAIKKRSLDESTSIDPTDGESQLQKFLEKIQLGAEGGKDTTSALTINPDPGASRPTLTLKIKVKLPGGLDPLEWPFHLSAASSTVLMSQLTVPLLRAQHACTKEISGLVNVVKEKDHVIQKLLDKLEAQGMDLGHVFPQVAAKGGRKVDRAKAEEKVKGLAAFDVEAWRAGFEIEDVQDTRQLVTQIFGHEVKIQTCIRSTETRDTDWWESLKGDTIKLPTGNTEIVGKTKKEKSELVVTGTKAAPKAEKSSEDDDDFQVQSSPPHLASATPAPKNVVDDDTTDDEDNLDAPSQRSKIPDSFPCSPPRVVSPSKNKVGSLGGSKKEAAKSPPSHDDSTTDDESVSSLKRNHHKTPIPVRTSPPKKKGGLGTLGGKKEPPSTLKEPTPPKERSPSPEESKPRKGKLGKLGGKKKEATPPPAPESEDESPKSPSGVKRRLGRLGGRSDSLAVDKPLAKAEVALKAPVVPKKEDSPEDPEERANQKRSQLKRELEAKAGAPMKKKRKF